MISPTPLAAFEAYWKKYGETKPAMRDGYLQAQRAYLAACAWQKAQDIRIVKQGCPDMANIVHCVRCHEHIVDALQEGAP